MELLAFPLSQGWVLSMAGSNCGCLKILRSLLTLYLQHRFQWHRVFLFIFVRVQSLKNPQQSSQAFKFHDPQYKIITQAN